MKKRVLLSWSSGKDSAWTLYKLNQDTDVEVVALLTTYNEKFQRVAIHGVRLELLRQQSKALALPLIEVSLPWPCSNELYEQALFNSLEQAAQVYQFTHIAHGDLFLEDIREYRIKLMNKMSFHPIFPIWGLPTKELAQGMVDSGLKAYITCVDSKSMDKSFAGRLFDQSFLEAIPESVDPCGENGEFHTFVFEAPMLNFALGVQAGERVERDDFVFADLLPV